jgi:serine protease inhibitor
VKSRIFLALCALLLVACRADVRDADHNSAGAAQPAETMRPNSGTTMNSNLAAASKAFGFNLFKQLRREAAAQNVFLSHLSVTFSMVMI